jgi:hypothetical protein
MELKNVVKFFIFLIVIVFDPLAVALIIAFNGLIEDKKKKQREILTEMMENDQKLGLYEVYGDKKEELLSKMAENNQKMGLYDDLVENNRFPIDLDGDGVIDGYDTDADGIIDEWLPEGHAERASGNRNLLPYYARPDFDWDDKSKWINDQNAVNYWLKYKKNQQEDLVKKY